MRTWLRWSGDPGHLAMYAAAALQAGELALLQFVLHTLVRGWAAHETGCTALTLVLSAMHNKSNAIQYILRLASNMQRKLLGYVYVPLMCFPWSRMVPHATEMEAGCWHLLVLQLGNADAALCLLL